MMKTNTLIIGLFLTGAILFFPVPFASGACCLAEEMLAHLSSYSAASHLAQSSRQRMLDYLVPCGLIWWTLISLLGVNLIKWIKTRA